MSCLFGKNRNIFFPKLDNNLNLITFSEIAERYLKSLGYEPVQCATEDEARKKASDLIRKRQYPVYFFKSDTTGEKDFEEFYTGGEKLDMNRYNSISIIENEATYDEEKVNLFTEKIQRIREQRKWTRNNLIDLFNYIIPEFNHKETGKFLDDKM